MLDKECAIEVKAHAMAAITELTSALQICGTQFSAEDVEQIKHGFALAIGSVHDELLRPIFSSYPELNHLRDQTQKSGTADNSSDSEDASG